eukprot:CAMPEP_0180215506 /NCGR_PEP_ID=MMETSP0987-20121128/15566_1 /TAXON_ID=697907 /ORGANISM="non described non described, Strain CCMP2293" /LENGTH=57 /DNA_ID=CAMNT_0022174237 /DNA_START=60 /DNA_END=229 /DNA_ORIENTATION=+
MNGPASGLRTNGSNAKSLFHKPFSHYLLRTWSHLIHGPASGLTSPPQDERARLRTCG